MSIRIIPVFCALSALIVSGLTGCSDEQPQPPSGTPEAGRTIGAGGGSDSGGDGSHGVLEPTSPTPNRDVDIRSVDLANTEWLYSYSGFDLPVTVKLVDGSASDDESGFLITYELGDVVYGDVDGDGRDDAVASLSRAQDNGYEAMWYVWLAHGPDAVQVKYPIAQTSRCGTFVESVMPADGSVTVTEYLRISGMDKDVPCSDPGTGLKKRTISIHSEASELWPVQTAPVSAWGGLCPGALYPDTSPGLVDMWAAPSKTSTVATTASPGGGALFPQKDAALMQREGWALVGFRLFGGGSDIPEVDMSCAWAVP